MAEIIITIIGLLVLVWIICASVSGAAQRRQLRDQTSGIIVEIRNDIKTGGYGVVRTKYVFVRTAEGQVVILINLPYPNIKVGDWLSNGVLVPAEPAPESAKSPPSLD